MTTPNANAECTSTVRRDNSGRRVVRTGSERAGAALAGRPWFTGSRQPARFRRRLYALTVAVAVAVAGAGLA